jgi:hypothetical protein
MVRFQLKHPFEGEKNEIIKKGNSDIGVHRFL